MSVLPDFFPTASEGPGCVEALFAAVCAEPVRLLFGFDTSLNILYEGNRNLKESHMVYMCNEHILT